MRARHLMWALAVSAAIAPLGVAGAAPAESPALTGSLYPAEENKPAASQLAKALGPARYILFDAGPSEEFRAQIRRAIGIHPVLHQEVSQSEQARGAVRAERAALYPRLSARFDGDYVLSREFGDATDNVVESLRPDGQFNAGLSVSQLLFDGGATFQRIKGARAEDREKKQTISARINELALAALSAYHDLAVHQAIVVLGGDYINRHESLLEDVRERKRLGAGTQADVMQAAARLAAARARVAQIKESMRLAEVRYEEFFQTAPPLLSRPSFEAHAVGTRAEAVSVALRRNPVIAAAAARTDSAEAAFKAERASRFPEVRANVDAVKYDLFEGSDDYDVRAGVNLNYDIFAGGARGAAIKRAREAARQELLDEKRVKRDVEREAAIAFERHAASGERLGALADAVIAHHEARSLIAQRFKAARGDLIDILQAENDYFEAGVAYLAGMADHDMAAYELMQHTGDLLRFFSPQPEYAERELARD